MGIAYHFYMRMSRKYYRFVNLVGDYWRRDDIRHWKAVTNNTLDTRKLVGYF